MEAETTTAEATATNGASTAPQSPPPPPDPSLDPELISQARTPPPIHSAPTPTAEELFKITPIAALKLLGANIQGLVTMTGDVPATPPSLAPSNSVSRMSGMAKERAEIVRSQSQTNLAQAAQEPPPQDSFFSAAGPGETTSSSTTTSVEAPEPIDGVQLRETPALMASTAVGIIPTVVGANAQPLYMQHGAITRKFFSKKPPPISVEDYLMRIHRFCPMSTAVYLATSFYIVRMAVEERLIPVTPRNCHRLLLAGLRVAMKALEDQSYGHVKIARVGGVSEAELARLEISFCFLTGFELIVSAESLMRHWESCKGGLGGGTGSSLMSTTPVLTLDPRRRKNLAPPVG